MPTLALKKKITSFQVMYTSVTTSHCLTVWNKQKHIGILNDKCMRMAKWDSAGEPSISVIINFYCHKKIAQFMLALNDRTLLLSLKDSTIYATIKWYIRHAKWHAFAVNKGLQI